MAKKQKLEEAPQTIDQYDFEPIKGYPMLNWKGKRPFTSTQYYPAQLKESYGKPVDGWMNRIYWGDNLQVMSHLLKEFRGKVNLIYIDPPFDSKADYKKVVKKRGKVIHADQTAFEEKQYSDIWTNDEYLQFMYERVVLLRELLSERGLIFIHCDWHKSHHLRCILDEIFGHENFVNEIIWQKCNSKNFTSNSLSNVHDTILMYSKQKEYVFHEIFEELNPDYVDSAYKFKEEDGRRYRILPLHAPGVRNGSTGEPWRGKRPPAGSHWRFRPSEIDEMDRNGLIVISENGVPGYKKYLDDSLGSRIGTIWLDAKQLPSSEKTDYPTQKPESIIEKILNIGSSEGDLVFDCFLGSGTTAAVAQRMNRKFVGADINLGSVATTTLRLLNDESVAKGFQVFNVNDYDLFRNEVEARSLLVSCLEINPLSESLFDGERDGRLFKIMPLNRIATRKDATDLVSQFDFKKFERRQKDNPNQSVEKITLVCMGHEPDFRAHLLKEIPYKIDIEVLDILRDRQDINFKRESEARIKVKGKKLVIERFYPMNLLQKLSLQKEKVTDWRELVESVLIDWNYDGAVLEPAIIDIPGKDELVRGDYEIPTEAGTIRIRITDLLSESLEVEVVRE